MGSIPPPEPQKQAERKIREQAQQTERKRQAGGPIESALGEGRVEPLKTTARCS